MFCGPGRQVLGYCRVKLSYKQHRLSQKVYVVHKLANNLLGLPAIIALNILYMLLASYSQKFKSDRNNYSHISGRLTNRMLPDKPVDKNLNLEIFKIC